jgi:hypothetical protein
VKMTGYGPELPLYTGCWGLLTTRNSSKGHPRLFRARQNRLLGCLRYSSKRLGLSSEKTKTDYLEFTLMVAHKDNKSLSRKLTQTRGAIHSVYIKSVATRLSHRQSLLWITARPHYPLGFSTTRQFRVLALSSSAYRSYEAR